MRTQPLRCNAPNAVSDAFMFRLPTALGWFYESHQRRDCVKNPSNPTNAVGGSFILSLHKGAPRVPRWAASP
jgi:hypothetical protein